LALCALVAVGLVFVPDDIVDRVSRGIGTARDYAVRKYSQKAPGIIQEAKSKAGEARTDAQNFYRLVVEDYYPAVRNWCASKFIY